MEDGRKVKKGDREAYGEDGRVVKTGDSEEYKVVGRRIKREIGRKKRKDGIY